VDVAGAPASIFRVGFTAELGYEIMVPIAHTAQLWDAILGHPNSRFGHAPRLANRVVSLAN